MGLAAPRKRTKINHDPNNTNWANNTSRFGHKILTAQGWTPGSTLGAKGANHASHYTAGSASHIRVAFKEDNLGLGAKNRVIDNEKFGLSVYDSVLSRLNGKSDAEIKEVEEKQEKRAKALYIGHRWGMMNFVRGGYLVGDKIEKKLEPCEEKQPTAKMERVSSTLDSEEAKKRKRSSEDDEGAASKKKKKSKTTDTPSGSNAEKSKKDRKTKSAPASVAGAAQPPRESSTSPAGDEEAEKKRRKAEKEARRREKEAKKTKKAAKAATEEKVELPRQTQLTADSSSSSANELSDKKRRKAEKGARKEAKRLKKEKKRIEHAKVSSSAEDTSTTATPEPRKDASAELPKTAATTMGAASRPAVTFRGRQAVRARYIQQKKMASLDPTAVKEIFMIKAQA